MTLKNWMAAKMEPQNLLFLAGFIWLVVGTALIVKGGQILAWKPGWLASAAVLGTVKAYFILDRIARRNAQRLHDCNEPLFIWRVYVGRTWCIIFLMIILGRLLRMQGVDPSFSGFFSLAVGWGLFLSSRLLWQGWFKELGKG